MSRAASSRRVRLRPVTLATISSIPSRRGVPVASSINALNSPCSDRWLALARSRSRLTWSSGTLLIERSKIELQNGAITEHVWGRKAIWSSRIDVTPSVAAGPRSGYQLAILPPSAFLMPATSEDLLAYLASLSIETETVEHPPLHTVEDSQALRGDIPGGHTKNLFVKDKKGNLFLLVLGETTVVDLKRVHEKIGAQGRVSFGSADLLEEVWGVRPGAVTPFGAINDKAVRVCVVLDDAMMRHERLNFHPLINTRTTGLKSADLVKFLRATGHEPLVAPLGQDQAGG